MRHVFRQKPNISRYAVRTTRIFLVISILVCRVPLNSHAQVTTKQSHPEAFTSQSPSAASSKYSVSQDTEEKTLEIVRARVGGDRQDSGIATYSSPSGFKIVNYKIREVSKWGDASYTVELSPEGILRIPWRVKSREIKGPFNIVIDTKTANLALDLVVTIARTEAGRLQAPPTASYIPASSDTSQPRTGLSTLVVVMGMGVIAMGVIIFFLLWRSRRHTRLLEKLKRDHRSAPGDELKRVEVEQDLKPLQIPDDLLASCKKEECIVFVGAGLSNYAGIPTRQEFVEGLLQWTMEKKILDADLLSSYRVALQKGQVDLVTDGIARAVRTTEGTGKDLLLSYFRDVFVRPSAQITPAYRLLKQIGFSGALTTNFDSLLEQALDAPVLTPRDVQKLLSKLVERDAFVLKLFGTLEQPETVQISSAEFRDSVADNRMFLEFVEKLFVSRTLLFLGINLDGIQSSLETLRLRNLPRSHYALVEVSESEWRAKAESLQRRYNVQILPYAASEGDPAVVNFLEGLATRVRSERGKLKIAPQEPPRLKRLQLENIGPFESLSLDFDPKWNILLGDNGVGKSNILKAIALALAGKHAQQYADRLIKFGRPSGRIVLELTDGATNVTELYRTSAEPEVKVLLQRELLGAERWLAMGFPPLRQVGWTLPKGPQPKPGNPYTTAGDVLPLVIGDADPRMTDLKQAILNFDYQSQAERGGRYENLLEDFFDAIGHMTQGVTLRRGRIDRQTSQIFVETDDGEVPLAAVSQGTQSLMCWIGLLLERLYEVYDNTHRPREGPALVLIDEIDAHMHPYWQQTMVPHLSELFKNIQFIATTHSPLIVTEMERNQVFVLNRDYETKKVFVGHAEEDFTWFRADQILTSSLFGLPRSRGSKPAGDVERYSELMGVKDKTPAQERELNELRGRLESGLAYCDTPAGRKIEAAIRSTLSQIIIPESGLPGDSASQKELPEGLKVNLRHQLAELLGDKKTGGEI